MNVVQLTISKVLDLVYVVLEGLSDLARAAPAETELLAGVEVGAGHKDIVAFCEVRELTFGRCGSPLLPMLGQGGLYARV